MSHHHISIDFNGQAHQFELGEYLHHDGERCKFKVFQNNKLVASFTPDHRNILHLCQNAGQLDNALLDKLADQIEERHPHGF